MAAAVETPPKSGGDNGGGKEGKNLLGAPTFEPLDNGRFKCVETGHELPAHARDSYSVSKRCRVGLIDFALAKKKPPLNMFKQDPLNSSKLVCKLTSDTINKSEEHIWKHINGKRFFNKLEQMEAGKLEENKSKRRVESRKRKDQKEKQMVKKRRKRRRRKRRKRKKLFLRSGTLLLIVIWRSLTFGCLLWESAGILMMEEMIGGVQIPNQPINKMKMMDQMLKMKMSTIYLRSFQRGQKGCL